MKELIKDKLVMPFAFFVFNMIFFSIGMLFSGHSFSQCLLYSFINCIWMDVILLPLLHKIRDRFY